MANSVTAAIAGAFASLLGAGGVTVTLRRGDQTTTDVKALPIRTTSFDEDEDGQLIEVVAYDFQIAAADYRFGGTVVLPESGDLIEEAPAVEGDEPPTHQALPIDGGPCWRYADPYRQVLRIHTKDSAAVDEEEEE